MERPVVRVRCRASLVASPDHQDVARGLVLHHRRHQAGGVTLEQRRDGGVEPPGGGRSSHGSVSPSSTPLRSGLVTFAQSERAELADLFDQVGPDAPTLCEGWTTHDLAAHLWIRETDPVGAAASWHVRWPASWSGGWPRPRRAGRTPSSSTRSATRPARFSVFAIPGVDEGANTIEYFVHHEDVRRGGAAPETVRELGEDVEGWLWRRLKLLARRAVPALDGGRGPGTRGVAGRRRRAGDHPRCRRRPHP